MTFEKDFPVLKDYIYSGSGKWFLFEDIEKYALDKQRVREALVKLKNMYRNEKHSECLNQLAYELGL